MSHTQRKAVLVACASFKGTLSSTQANRIVAAELRATGLSVKTLVIADGGEGLVTALCTSQPKAQRVRVRVHGPLGHLASKSKCDRGPAYRRHARFALLPRGKGFSKMTAVIEMAESSGIWFMPPEKLNPEKTSTWGVGQQIRAALDRGVRRIILGLGGSSTNDGGAGMAQALGVRLLDRDGHELEPGGAALIRLHRIDCSGLDRRLKKTEFLICCDVRNPLCGANGASAIFGPQKGASPAQVKRLDVALRNYARCIRRDLGQTVARVPGAGAAGGLGAGCLAFFHARLYRGIDLLLETLQFQQRLQDCALVITGEGCLDRQTLMGKAPGGIAEHTRRAGLPCLAIGGGMQAQDQRTLRRYFTELHTLQAVAGSVETARKNARAILRDLVRAQAARWKAKYCGR